jgi:hypothetical protein
MYNQWRSPKKWYEEERNIRGSPLIAKFVVILFINPTFK